MSSKTSIKGLELMLLWKNRPLGGARGGGGSVIKTTWEKGGSLRIPNSPISSVASWASLYHCLSIVTWAKYWKDKTTYSQPPSVIKQMSLAPAQVPSLHTAVESRKMRPRGCTGPDAKTWQRVEAWFHHALALSRELSLWISNSSLVT